jgi:hypothetical protein
MPTLANDTLALPLISRGAARRSESPYRSALAELSPHRRTKIIGLRLGYQDPQRPTGPVDGDGSRRPHTCRSR